ncbi:uncharacterized protein CLAFUR5_12307 [Fulvia fulva]|uniref:Uncharacterized protein n=1 Tax=Passalora fulva TaxID=5499 RepID=A0A9Q8UU99_PASFU|nr:uncharacterized protein CLAFUR5_12307 [Fulvia fulva]KAK4616797.1 hypothetical protein CLAFUR0_09935 [Fulvia fulva]UJO22734.1 hypothetical protein CLAFUR5_12307 [Fulvia fulva]
MTTVPDQLISIKFRGGHRKPSDTPEVTKATKKNKKKVANSKYPTGASSDVPGDEDELSGNGSIFPKAPSMTDLLPRARTALPLWQVLRSHEIASGWWPGSKD